MSSATYTGQLCATHVGGKLHHSSYELLGIDDTDEERDFKVTLHRVVHTEGISTVRMVFTVVEYDRNNIGKTRKNQIVRDLDCTEILILSNH